MHTSQEIALNLTTMPCRHELRGSRGLGVFLMIFSLLWGGMPTVMLLMMLQSGEFKPEMLFVLIFTVVGTVLFLFGLQQLTSRTILDFDGSSIRMRRQFLFGAKEWSEQLSAYRGVVARSEHHSGNRNSASYTLYIVELVHPDSSRNVKLWQSRRSDGFRTRWESYCRELGLPALERDGDAYVSRNVADLDKSVRELAAEGKLDASFDPSRKVPDGLNLRACGQSLEVLIAKSEFPPWALLIAMAIPSVFIYIGFFRQDGPLLFGIVGALFGVLMAWSFAWSLITRRLVRISPDGVHVLRRTPWGETSGRTIAAADIESVTVGRKEGGGMEAVRVVTDAGEVCVGEGLKREALEWLKSCVLHVMTS